MTQTVFQEGDDGVQLIVNDDGGDKAVRGPSGGSFPVHVVYGGGDRFSADTARKLGDIALASMRTYAPTTEVFAEIFKMDAKHAASVYELVVSKLEKEPVEDLRIDFEDGFGFRSDDEEDASARTAASQLADAYKTGRITRFCGFRIKSLGTETYKRAVRTLDIFLETMLTATGGHIPANFVVTLPKVTSKDQVKELSERLEDVEKEYGLAEGSFGIELMIETPSAVINRKGKIAVPKMIKYAEGRCRSLHFGAYDYTSALGIAGMYQDVRHPACSFARSLIQVAIADTDVRLVDSVTTLLPTPLHRGEELSDHQVAENRTAIHSGWRRHFRDINASFADGIYQSWDLHPNQLVSRYAAVYGFYLSEYAEQLLRLRAFLDRSTKATLTGNTFDDAASAQGIVNFFRRGRDCGAFSPEVFKRDLSIEAEDLDLPFSLLVERRT